MRRQSSRFAGTRPTTGARLFASTSFGRATGSSVASSSRRPNPATERGRTLGFAVASVLPVKGTDPDAAEPSAAANPGDQATDALAAGTAPTPAPSHPAVEASTAEGKSPAPARPSAPPAASSGSASPSDADADSPVPVRRGGVPSRVAIDVFGVGASGVGDSVGLGGGVGFHWYVADRLSLRLGADARVGRMDKAEADLTTIAMAAGVAVHPWNPTRAVPFGASLRADYLVVHEEAAHFDGDELSPTTRGRWLSGFDAVAEASWFPTPEIGILAGIGMEDVLAPTYVELKTVQETIPAVRVIGEAGLRLRF